jgi:hypothetical protein
MAALHDGTDFLIAKYAVAVSPGLSLRLTDDAEFDPALRSRSAKVLASGLSVQGEDKTFAALPNVEAELATIEQLYGGTTLLNEQFKVPSFSRELARPVEDEYSIVHIASHGVFAADVADTYVLAYDGKLNLTSLEMLIRPYQLQGKPIDLLTLSACQTSAGDDQAALERASLGLGGLAVKAGAPKPDISTPEKLKAVLLAAKSVGVSRGASGIYASGPMMEKLGIADQMKGKIVTATGTVGDAVAKGDVEVGFHGRNTEIGIFSFARSSSFSAWNFVSS